MHFSKLKISADATSRLRFLRQRTGLTPNLLCRAAIMTSLEEGAVGRVPPPDEEGSEFNAYTLVGEHGDLIAALIRFVEEPNERSRLDDEKLLQRLRSHIQRGVGTLAVRVRSPAELLRLVPSVSDAIHSS